MLNRALRLIEIYMYTIIFLTQHECCMFFRELNLFDNMCNPRAINFDTCICIWLKKIFWTGFENFESTIIFWARFLILIGITWCLLPCEVKMSYKKISTSYTNQQEESHNYSWIIVKWEKGENTIIYIFYNLKIWKKVLKKCL